MERQAALVLTIIFFFMFYVLLYYGVRITMCASIVLATFISLILLNIFYSPKQVIDDESDFTLVIYGIVEIIGIITIIIYVLYKTLTDVRQMDCNWITN